MEDKDIIPIYLYHNIDINKEVFLSKISLTELKDNNWKLHKLFYVFRSNIRPIPEGTKLFYVIHKTKSPYNIIEYKFVYDTSNNKNEKDKISFIAYNRPVYNCIKLCFYFNLDIPNNIFATFDKNIMKNTTWRLVTVCPIIYVLPNKDTKFYLNNGRCLPMPMLQNTFDVYNNKYVNIEYNDCINLNKPFVGILDIAESYNGYISKKNKNKVLIKKQNSKGNFKRKNFYLFFFILLSLLILIIIFLLYQKKRFKK